ncbi:MAG: nicotinate phosphoribosyltransferase [Candidatus Altiarchaeales archaeon]|nr:nicotinate phosphoribosyltransferase [Candidatus Altiarchaeales archaeon]
MSEFQPIIVDPTDTDQYKFTMAQMFMHQFPGATGKYRFKCRNKGIDLLPYREEIERQIDHLCTLKISPVMLAYMSAQRFYKPDFIEFLRLFQFNRDYIHVGERDGELDIWAEGPLVNTMLFEIPVLEIVSEVYARAAYPKDCYREGLKRLEEKIKLIRAYAEKMMLPPTKALPIIDFGGRRAAFRDWHKRTVKTLRDERVLIGTSNVWLAQMLDLVCIGTMAHETFQAGQAMGIRLMDSQKYVMQKWAEEYRGDLGIALSDTLGFDKFLHDFDMYFAKLFDGCRHDSGDPIKWGERLIEHYKSMRIDPMTKTAVFSDGLNVPRAIEIMDHFRGRIKVSFGIGTNLSNDMGPKALQLVMKIIECNGQPVAKLSDTPGKAMCEDTDYEKELKRLIEREIA